MTTLECLLWIAIACFIGSLASLTLVLLDRRRIKGRQTEAQRSPDESREQLNVLIRQAGKAMIEKNPEEAMAACLDMFTLRVRSAPKAMSEVERKNLEKAALSCLFFAFCAHCGIDPSEGFDAADEKMDSPKTPE